MFDSVTNLFRNTIYIKARVEKLYLLQIETGKELNLLPEVAIETTNGKKKVLEYGAEAKAKKGLLNTEVVNGFRHPRTLLADFTVAELVLKHGFRMVISKSLFAPSPIVIFHPLELDEGGYTQVELRAFEELCIQAGARKVYIKTGKELSKEELSTLANSNYSGMESVIKTLIKEK